MIVCGVAAALAFDGEFASATEPGARIDNIAMLHFTVGGIGQSVQSNEASTIVDELLDLTLVRTGSGTAVRDPKTTIAAMLTNAGSGHEAFALSVTAGGTTVSGATVAIDRDANGQYDPAHDVPLTGGQTAMLAPGASVALVIVADTSAPNIASLTIVAKAATMSGAPGALAGGQGDGGSDAVVGTTGAAASFTVGIVDAASPPTLTKAQTVKAPDGSSRPMSGAVVTYTLDAAFASPAAGVRVADPIPAGTRYVAGSLTLDGAALSDAADNDAGQADATAIAVMIGTVPSAATHRVQFQVQIQ